MRVRVPSLGHFFLDILSNLCMIEGIMNYISKEKTTPQPSSKAEAPKYTSWSGGGDSGCSKLGGFTVSTYNHNDFVGATAHTSHGESYAKYFQIPLDKVDEFCQALIEAKDFALQHENNK